MNGSYSVAQYVIGALIGMVFGFCVGYINMRITKAAVVKNGGNGLAAVTATNFARSLVNVIALAIVFFTRNVVPLPFYATLLGTATGLAVGNVFFVWRLTKEMRKEMESRPQSGDDSGGGE